MSIQSDLFYQLMKLVNYRENNNRKFLAEVETGIHRDSMARPRPIRKIYRKCIVEQSEVTGYPVFMVRPKSGLPGQIIIYLHGGAYIREAVGMHWNFVYSLIRQSGCGVVFPNYPVAPEHSYREVFEMTEKVYLDVIQRYEPQNVILMGDSAGGGLALALAIKFRDGQVPQPRHIIMLSPWLDLSMSHPAIAETEKFDPFLPVEGLKVAGRSYASDLPIESPLVSPVYGDFLGLGQLTLFTGTYDILNPDARKMKAICDAKGIAINYYEYPEMLHVWMIMGFPESEKVLQQIIEIIGTA